VSAVEIPELSGFTEVYGMKISMIGEDGDMVILGHHATIYALAAFNGYAVDVVGLDDVYDGLVADPGPTAVKAIKQGWASLKTTCDEFREDEHDPDCSECIEISECSWWMEIGEHQHPNSFPVTYFTA
jgi:hypothetical protein